MAKKKQSKKNTVKKQEEVKQEEVKVEETKPVEEKKEKSEVKKAKTTEKNEKDKKSFVKDFKAELKKVTWPTPKQLVNNTAVVIVSVLVVAAIVFILDVCFETLNNYGVEKLKSIVKTEESAGATNTTDDSVTVVDGSTNTTENTTSEASNTTENTTVEDTNSVSPEGQTEQ